MREILPVLTALSPIDILGDENGRFFLEHSVVVKDRLRLRGLLRGIFEAKNADGVGRHDEPVFRDGRALRYPIRKPLLHFAEWVSVMCVRTFGDEKWGGGSAVEATSRKAREWRTQSLFRIDHQG